MKKKVVVVGGGFGGLSCVNALKGKQELDIVLIDRRNYHLFQPLLYQVATAGLSPAEIAMPIRSIFAKSKHVNVTLDNVVGIDLINSIVKTSHSEHTFDYLVLACGASHSYFGHSEWEDFAPGLKSLEQATEIRRRILTSFEDAEKELDPSIQKKHLTFVIVGGGPTGVELAGAISEIARQTLESDFRNIDPSQTKTILIEAGERILPSFTHSLSKKAQTDLEKMGVTVLTKTKVSRITKQGVEFGDQSLTASTVLWAAGVFPSQLGRQFQSLDPQGRVVVLPDLSVPKHPNVFCIGDMAHFAIAHEPLPGLAPVAMQQGRWVAKNILQDLWNKKRLPFRYFDKGQMATIGRNKAVLQYGKIRMSGIWAWLAWLIIHIYYLIGFKNRFFVLVQWGWAYLTFKRGARLIMQTDWHLESVGSNKTLQE